MATVLSTFQVRRTEAMLAVLLGLIVLINLVLLYGYVSAEDRRDRTQQQVVAVEAAVTKMRRPEDLDALKKELAELEAKAASSPNTFPKDIDNLALTGLIVNAARQTGVEISRTEIGAQGTEKFGNDDYRSFKYTILARGQLTQMAPFLNRLETGGFNTLVVTGQSYQLTNSVWNVTIDLTAYAQRAG